MISARGIITDEGDNVPIVAAFLQIGSGVGSHLPNQFREGRIGALTEKFYLDDEVKRWDREVSARVLADAFAALIIRANWILQQHNVLYVTLII
jgi:hypothetical protein